MRTTRSSGWMGRISTRTLRLSAIVLGAGVLMATHAARAGDDDNGDDKTFEEKIIDGIMKGIGATNMDNSDIDYRERFAEAESYFTPGAWSELQAELKRTDIVNMVVTNKMIVVGQVTGAANWPSMFAPWL